MTASTPKLDARDPYAILGLPKGATVQEVKQAYRKLADAWHPDRESGDEERFKDVTWAYELLSSPDKVKAFEREQALARAAIDAKRREAARKRRADERAREQSRAVGDQFRGNRGRTPRSSSQGKASPGGFRGAPPQGRPPRPPSAGRPRSVSEPRTPLTEFRPSSWSNVCREAVPFAVAAVGALLSVGLVVSVVSAAEGKSPNFGEAMLGLAGTVGFWVGVGFTLKALVDMSNRGRVVAIAIVTILALAGLTLGSVVGGSGRTADSAPVAPASQASVPTPQEATAKAEARERDAAETRIAELKFECRKRYICQLALGGEPSLPLFINGMDTNLARYLSGHGYSDLWTDSDNTFDASFLGSTAPRPHGAKFRYIATLHLGGCECEIGKEKESGLVFENGGEGEEPSMTPPSVSESGVTVRWTVTWELKDPAGRVVRRLSYTVGVAKCDPQLEVDGETPCGRSSRALLDETPREYKPPPLFPYE